MIRLFNIEWEKLKSYRAFWVMVILYLFILATIIFGLPAFLDFLASKTDDNVAIKAFKLIVFNFPDIWQNISYVASMRAFIKIILAIIVVIIITNEFTFLTIRTNILSGMSRTEFLLGKMEVIFMLSLLSTAAIFLSGLYLGLTNSSVITAGAIIGKTVYLLAYFIEVFTFLMFAFLIAVLVKKTGFSVIILLLYPLIEVIIQYNFIPENFHKYLPLNAMNHLIWSPNTSLIKVKTPEFNMEFQEFLSFSDVVVCLLYGVFFTTIIYFYLKKKDL